MPITPVRIRVATLDDLPDVQSCAQAAYAKYIERIGQKPAPMIADFASQIALDQLYCALLGSIVVGYVVFYREADHLQLENVAVLPAHAGKGIGKLLIDYVEKSAADKGLEAVELYTNEAMTENLVLYPKLGYRETDRRRQDGFNRVFFRKIVCLNI